MIVIVLPKLIDAPGIKVNIIKFRTLKFLIKWYVQIVQIQTRLLLSESSLPFHDLLILVTSENPEFRQKVRDKVFEILGYFYHTIF